MIRRIALVVLAAGGFALTACGQVDVPKVTIPSINMPGVNVPSVTIPSEINLNTGVLLEAKGFQPNADKTEYTKGDITIMMAGGKPTSVKYNNQLLNCKPTTQSVLNGAAKSLTGGSDQEVAQQFCG